MSPQQQQKHLHQKIIRWIYNAQIWIQKNEIVNATSRLNTDDLDIHAMVEKVH